MTIPKQTTFDIVARHLLAQGRKAETDLGACMYRVDGLRCAAGVLIPDESYSEGMEGSSVTFCGAATEAGQVLISLGHDIALVRELQRVHDDSDVKQWRDALTELATLEGLSTDALV